METISVINVNGVNISVLNVSGMNVNDGNLRGCEYKWYECK